MVNGRKIVPEKKAPLNRKCRREAPFGPLAAGADRTEEKQHKKKGIINEISARVFGR